MWSPEACFEMLLIFSLKGVGERILFWSCFAKEESDAKLQPAQGGAGQRGALWKGSMGSAGQVQPSQATPYLLREFVPSLLLLGTDPEHPCAGDGLEISTDF